MTFGMFQSEEVHLSEPSRLWGLLPTAPPSCRRAGRLRFAPLGQGHILCGIERLVLPDLLEVLAQDTLGIATDPFDLFCNRCSPLCLFRVQKSAAN